VVALVVLVGVVRPAGALDDDPPGEGDPPPGTNCVMDITQASLSLSASRVTLGQAVQIAWFVQKPKSCGSGAPNLYISGIGPVYTLSGSTTVVPKNNRSYTLTASRFGAYRTLDTESVYVELPRTAAGNMGSQALSGENLR
jgi:hypothetical protein